MPIRPELQHFYETPGWYDARRLVLERAGGKFDETEQYVGGARCERCGVPDGVTVRRYRGMWVDPDKLKWRGEEGKLLTPQPRPAYSQCRLVTIVIGVAHLDGIAGHDDPANLQALCQWDHLQLDRPAHLSNAHLTRSLKKDAERPLLLEASA